ncbi:MAG: RNA polymerase sigma factor [Planctomycetota bacterium]
MSRPTNEQIAGWYPRLFRKALRLTGRVELAADLTQEAFCRALKGWDSFRGEALTSTWLHYILLNCVRDWHRRQAKRRHARLDEWAIAVVEDGSERPPEQLARREQLEHLREAVAGLPENLRPAFVATVLDGHTYEGAAELLSVPVGTIASRVHEARKHLRAAMRKAFPEVMP